MEGRWLAMMMTLAAAGIIGGIVMYGDVRELQLALNNHQQIGTHNGAKDMVDREIKPIRKDVAKNKRKLETIDKRQLRQDMMLEGIADKMDVHVPRPIPEDRDRDEE